MICPTEILPVGRRLMLESYFAASRSHSVTRELRCRTSTEQTVVARAVFRLSSCRGRSPVSANRFCVRTTSRTTFQLSFSMTYDRPPDEYFVHQRFRLAKSGHGGLTRLPFTFCVLVVSVAGIVFLAISASDLHLGPSVQDRIMLALICTYVESIVLLIPALLRQHNVDRRCLTAFIVFLPAVNLIYMAILVCEPEGDRLHRVNRSRLATPKWIGFLLLFLLFYLHVMVLQ